MTHPSLRYTRSGTLQPTGPGIFQVLSPEPEEGHTGELCLAQFGESHLTTHLHTYPRSTCKIWWHSGAPEVIPLRKRRYVCLGGSTPLDFSARGSTNVVFSLPRGVGAVEFPDRSEGNDERGVAVHL